MKANNILNDINEEDLKLSEITSKIGYDLYEKTKKEFPEETVEDFQKISCSLESAIIYFIANEVGEEHIDYYYEEFCKSLKYNCERIKKYNKLEDNQYIFSKELRENMSKFNEMTIEEAIGSPEFYESLMDHAKMTREEKNAVWDKIGRPEFKRN